MFRPMHCQIIIFFQVSTLLNKEVKSVPILTRIVLPTFLQKKKGVVIGVSSTAASFPLPYLALYSASKVMELVVNDETYESYSSKRHFNLK